MKKTMTPAEFKVRWDSNDRGGGINFEDVAECAKAWGLCSRPKIMPMEAVLKMVLEHAGIKYGNEIRIINLRNYESQDNEILVKVCRPSVLGNPFKMENEGKRDYVCDLYERWFDEKLGDAEPKFMNALMRIHKLAQNHDVALGCYCAPKRCHAETIKRYLENLG